MPSPALVIADDFSWLPPAPPRTYRLYPGETLALRAGSGKTGSAWPHGNRYVHVSPLPGPWDNDIAPHLVDIMDTFAQEYFQHGTIAGGSQGGKTDLLHNCIGMVADNAPGPALLIMQDQATGGDTITDRLIPMFRDTPTLRKLRTKNPDDMSRQRLRLRNGMTLYLAWSNSEGRLASKPCRYLFRDEIDLWPVSALKKSWARTRAFKHSRKIMDACTASTVDGAVWAAQKHAQEIRDYYAVCPHCKHEQTLKFGQIRWADGVIDPTELAENGSAWYECEQCQGIWDEDDRDDAVKAGRWKRRDTGVIHLRPSSVWWHVPPMLSRFVFFNEIAQAYLTTLTEPTLENLKYFYNDCLGLPLPEESDGETVKETELYKRREHYAPEDQGWRVPMAACLLTADTDVQANRLECEVVAWGAGHESWGVEYKVFHGDTSKDDVWQQLHDWASTQTWRHESGSPLAIARMGVDIGFRADMVAKFVRRSRRYLAHKGSNNSSAPLVPRKPSRSPKYKVPFYELGVSDGKDTLFTWLNNEPGGARSCHFPMFYGYDFEYFRMLCAEHAVKEKNRRTNKLETVWKLRPGFQRNEALDVRVGNMAVREILNPNYAKHSAALQVQTSPSVADQAEQQAAIEQKPHVRPARIRRAMRSGGGGFVSGWKK
jgi:phage terminase large subunit GpA-like protein